VLDEHDRFGRTPGLRAVEAVELLKVNDEIAAALGRAGVDYELARHMIERSQHRHACPGAGTCRFAHDFAHTLARVGCVNASLSLP
jgi:hypothetical protein